MSIAAILRYQRTKEREKKVFIAIFREGAGGEVLEFTD
jgi:hypothetical protein